MEGGLVVEVGQGEVVTAARTADNSLDYTYQYIAQTVNCTKT